MPHRYFVYCLEGCYKSHLLFLLYSDIDFAELPNTTPPKLKLYLPSNEPGQPGIYQEVDVSFDCCGFYHQYSCVIMVIS